MKLEVLLLLAIMLVGICAAEESVNLKKEDEKKA